MDTHRLSNSILFADISIDGLAIVWENARRSKGRITQT
jgi:hypothetical protein